MSLKFYNTYTNTTEEFIPGGARKNSPSEYPPVTVYSCGPTVYSYAHIGNFRTFTLNDLLRRYLLFSGYRINQTMNITDVDDKTIKGASENNLSLSDFTKKYTDIFFEDLKSLAIEEFEHYPRATDNIDAMDEIIERLKSKGLVYEKDGSLYFSISKFVNYGKLSNLEKRETITGARYDADEYDKDDARDFALWKASKENEPSWNITSMDGGRPGWHIECSAMIRKIYGTTIDIHTGGVDLIFPHHENEIAQSEAAYGEPFARYWLHWEHLLVEGSKMSKSKGNFYTLRDLTGMGYSTRSIRYLLLSAHYRKQLNFTLEGLRGSQSSLEKIDNFTARIESVPDRPGHESSLVNTAVKQLMNDFTESMDNDLNTSGAFAAFFEFMHAVNPHLDSPDATGADKKALLDAVALIDSVFGFILVKENKIDSAFEKRIENFIEERKQARADKNFKRSDEIRDLLLSEGVILEDGKEGTRWKLKK